MVKYLKVTNNLLNLIKENSQDIDKYFTFGTFWVSDSNWFHYGMGIFYGSSVITITNILNPELSLKNFSETEFFKLLRSEGENNLAIEFNTFEELDQFCDALGGGNSTINKLAIKLNIPLQSNQHEEVANKIIYERKRLSAIKKLAINLNNSSVKEFHIEANPVIDELGGLTNNELYELSYNLSENKNLRRIAFPWSAIGNKAAQGIVYMLEHNKELEKLGCVCSVFRENAYQLLEKYITEKGGLTDYYATIGENIPILSTKLNDTKLSHPQHISLMVELVIKMQKKLEELSRLLFTIDFESLLNRELDFKEDAALLINKLKPENPYEHVQSIYQMQKELQHLTVYFVNIHNYVSSKVHEKEMKRIHESQPQFSKKTCLFQLREYGQLLELLLKINGLKIAVEEEFLNSNSSSTLINAYEIKKNVLNNLWNKAVHFISLNPQEKKEEAQKFQDEVLDYIKQLNHFYKKNTQSFFISKKENKIYELIDNLLFTTSNYTSIFILAEKEKMDSLGSEMHFSISVIKDEFNQFNGVHKNIEHELKKIDKIDLSELKQEKLIQIFTQLDCSLVTMEKSRDKLLYSIEHLDPKESKDTTKNITNDVIYKFNIDKTNIDRKKSLIKIAIDIILTSGNDMKNTNS